jgi:hypothetical protein
MMNGILTRRIRTCFTLYACAVWLQLLPFARAATEPQIQHSVEPATQRDGRLEEAIQREIGQNSFSYAYNRVGLRNGIEPEVLVYLTSKDACSSGGCTLLVFASESGAYRLISYITLVHVPVVVSSHASNSWRDLIIAVGGGGVEPYYSVLSFDGQKYPENPTTAPASPLKKPVKGVAYFTGMEQSKSVFVVSP